jgi:nitroimidazol reductase NimA-like FMN-containing flavoprotein (pyridoxamine 5'-phosphate oxidase superfamily)
MTPIRDLNAGDVVVQDLSREECLGLLARTPVGRIGGMAHDRPFVLPVNFVLDGQTVVFRTEPGTKLDGASFGRVAFEIDGIDEDAKLGWSVVVQGVGTEITEMIDDYSGRLRELKVVPWVPGDKAHLVAIHAESITGRRLART